MPVSKVTQPLRHEPSIDEADFTTVHRPSGVVVKVAKKAVAKGAKPGKGKRSVADMLASLSTDTERAKYALDRIAGLEDQIEKVLKLCTPGARVLVLKERKSLARYAPEEE